MGMKRRGCFRGCDGLLSIIFPRCPYSDDLTTFICTAALPMPRIAHKATFKAASENFTLLLAVQHLLHSPILQNDDTPGNSSSDVLAHNPLLFTLSGSKDGILATHDELVTSKTTNHLVEYLRKVLQLSATHINLIYCLTSISLAE